MFKDLGFPFHFLLQNCLTFINRPGLVLGLQEREGKILTGMLQLSLTLTEYGPYEMIRRLKCSNVEEYI